MDNTEDNKRGPDLSLGVAVSDIPASGLLKGHVGDEDVLLARAGGTYFAIGSACTHYGGPLAEGMLDGVTVRCPWHHACFSLRTGEALHAPAFDPVACWNVEQRGEKIFVTGKAKALPARKPISGPAPSRIVIIGGGAAGFAAAEQLRRDGYQGSLVMLSDDADPPVDRPNLSKDYLAGTAEEEWVPLRASDWYRDNAIELRLNTKASKIDPRAREVEIADGTRIPYERLLLATGAEPIRLDMPGGDLPHVHVLRTLKDCRAIIAAAKRARRVVVIGASFIGLETAAALRTRNLDVHIVAPEKRPLEKVFGAELGDFVRSLHEEKGVVFHLENTAAAIEPNRVTLKDGQTLDADLVVMGVGVRPRTQIAEQAGLKLDRGVAVNEYLETSAADIFAAGDIARWPDRHSGESLRVEHWVVAERQGQAAARAMLGSRDRYAGVPFFWSQHYDVPINYVGHASEWDALDIEGDVQARDCVVRYRKDGELCAVASIYRDVDSLAAEIAMEGATASM
ncbi:MAG TPA: FAD-dependent oxidoreductase [Xanthobacteraceae bacterium]|jgi:NADPH-dependent 2,4-dienoyl-CoA reductase/sulfur reductase-like enzyme/nitrite reductase/ring-hydroxylating ferredoxin subunit